MTIFSFCCVVYHFGFSQEIHDKSTGLEPNLVFFCLLLLLYRYSENLLLEIISNYTFPLLSLERCFVERGMNGTYPFFSSRTGLSHLLVVATQFAEYPCVIRLFILVCVVSLILTIVHTVH